MKQLALLFSHNLTTDQNEDIEKNLKVNIIYSLPDVLQKLWSQVPTSQDLDFNLYLEEMKSFLSHSLSRGDYLLIQGDFGATYHMVNYAKEQGFVPIYSVNKRISKEKLEEGIVKKYSEFKHECFREYH